MKDDDCDYGVDAAAADTFSHSSNEDHDDDEYSYDGDDAEAEEKVPFWRQHLWAIVVSVIAATASHLVQQSHRENADEVQVSPRHAYVDKFHRTANISFCQSLPEEISGGGLKTMDFYIPQDLFESVVAYYQADEFEDDLYENLNSNALSLDNPEFQCLVGQQRHNSPHQKFKGITYYYKNPTLQEIYPELAAQGGADDSKMSRQRKLQQPPLVFTGFAAKFVNMSPKPVLLFWDGKGGRADANKLVGEIPPFESLGTATMPGHSFHVTPIYDSSTALQRWVVTADTAMVHFEPNTPGEMQATLLHKDNVAYAKYQRQLVNQAFARDYLISSKRHWLANFPRHFPMHYMHSANYIGQEHQVGKYKLTVASVTPRVYLVDNFLSSEECQSVIDISKEEGMQLSTLHTGATAEQTRDLSTRSSSNTWLSRDTNALTEKIYLRTAEVMNIDPELFQKFHETNAHHHSIAESLQVVRYKTGGEEYQPHHDFVYPSIDHRYQPTRFATLLVYLNDVPEGGETRFPRAVNNYNAQGLEVKPKVGQAVLFYNMLEDGNVDDLSQHGSNPTTDHEKWLANLWVWDPVIG
jgi:prolyl 4-hydroxylase